VEVSKDGRTVVAEEMDTQPYTECGITFSKVGVYRCVGQNNYRRITFPRHAITGKALICEGLIISIPAGTINEIF
jgi:hypothetical protein